MQYRDLIVKFSAKYELPPAIVYGVCMTESSMNHKATRIEPKYRWVYRVDHFAEITGIPKALERQQQKTSFGLCQIMGGVLRENGYLGRISDILGFPEKQLDYGCKHLAHKINRYGFELGILSYNSGSPRPADDGMFLMPTEQPNAVYLQKVLKYSKEFT